MSENCETNVNHDTGTDMCDDDTIYEEVDFPITIDEIDRSIIKLKREKSHGDDCILNEFLIEFKDTLLPM